MDNCIEHSGPSRDKQGYGIKWVGGKPKRAHRVAWEEAHGVIPDGMYVLHQCDNPPCVNTDHLFLGTAADNAADRDAKGRVARLRGPANANAKFTQEDADSVRREYISQYEKVPRRGKSWIWRSNSLELADKYGVHYKTISRIVRNKVYTDDPAT